MYNRGRPSAYGEEEGQTMCRLRGHHSKRPLKWRHLPDSSRLVDSVREETVNQISESILLYRLVES
jgi:hypothetical protein